MNGIQKYGRGAAQGFSKGFSKGFSIVELMIAVVLGLIILAGVVSVYLSNSQSFRFNSQMSRVQENGRFAMNIIEDDVRQAAYGGFVRLGLDGEDDVDTMFDQAVDKVKCIDTLPGKPATLRTELTKENWVKGVTWDKGTLTLNVYGIPRDQSSIPDTSTSEPFIEKGNEEIGCKTVLKADYDSFTPQQRATNVPAPFVVTYWLEGNELKRQRSDQTPHPIVGTDYTMLVNVDKFLVCAGVANVDGANKMEEGITWDATAGGLSETDNKWKRVTAVQVDLILASAAHDNVSNENRVQTYKLCDGTTWTSPDDPDDTTAPGDKRLHKLFHSTITLRNTAPNGFARDDSSRQCDLDSPPSTCP